MAKSTGIDWHQSLFLWMKKNNRSLIKDNLFDNAY